VLGERVIVIVVVLIIVIVVIKPEERGLCQREVTLPHLPLPSLNLLPVLLPVVYIQILGITPTERTRRTPRTGQTEVILQKMKKKQMKILGGI